MSELSELLYEYALGQLEPSERARAEALLSGSNALRAELQQIQDALQAVPLALSPLAPSAELRTRMLDSLDGPMVLSRARRALGEIFELSRDAVRDVLTLIERPESWTDSGVAGFSFVHFAGGPKTAGLECGLIRLSAGFTFPRHRHLGEEVTLVVQGAYTDLSSGVVYGPGDVSRLATGTEHSFQVHADEDLIYGILMVADAVEIFWPSP